MAVYLKEFETQAAYEAAQSGLILPNVSFIDENHSVAYKPYVDPYGGHEYVDLGLSVKWATMNVGATSVTDYGLYFQWGDTQGYTASQAGSGEGQKKFAWADYKYSKNGTGSSSDMTKYNSTDGLITLTSEDDAVQAAWGGKWRMPTKDEFLELKDAVNAERTQINGVNGLLCTAKNGSDVQLFFPASDSCGGWNIVPTQGSAINYWSSTLHNDKTRAYLLSVQGSYQYWDWDYGRYFGHPVRGVAE